MQQVLINDEIIGNRVRIPDGRAAVKGETFQQPLDTISGKVKSSMIHSQKTCLLLVQIAFAGEGERLCPTYGLKPGLSYYANRTEVY
jgi:hypothetical protein